LLFFAGPTASPRETFRRESRPVPTEPRRRCPVDSVRSPAACGRRPLSSFLALGHGLPRRAICSGPRRRRSVGNGHRKVAQRSARRSGPFKLSGSAGQGMPAAVSDGGRATSASSTSTREPPLRLARLAPPASTSSIDALGAVLHRPGGAACPRVPGRRGWPIGRNRDACRHRLVWKLAHSSGFSCSPPPPAAGRGVRHGPATEIAKAMSRPP